VLFCGKQFAFIRGWFLAISFLPITQEFQVVFHVIGGFGLADSYQPPNFLTDRSSLLIPDYDAGMVSCRSQEFGVKPAEIRSIVGLERAPLIAGPGQLLFV